MNTRKVNALKVNARKLLVSVLMLVSVLFTACAPAATQAPTDVPPTTIPATVAPTVAPDQALTTFSSSTFKLPMTFSYYGPDWNLEEFPNQVYLQSKLKPEWGQLAINLVDGATIADPNSAAEIPWPQDLVAYLRLNPHIEAEEPKPVTFGGFNGIQIDAYAEYTGDQRAFIRIAGPAEGWLYLDGEEMWRFIVLDNVNGERLVITMITAPPLNELQMFADVAQKVLDTVVFTKP